MIRGIHHAAISTGNLKTSLEFYRDLLGFEVVVEGQFPMGSEPAGEIMGLEDPSGKVAMLKVGNMMIEIFQFDSPAPKTCDSLRPVCDHGITHIALDVIDIESEYERLKAAGMTFHCPPQDLGIVKTTYGRDPDGNVIEIQELTKSDSPIAL